MPVQRSRNTIDYGDTTGASVVTLEDALGNALISLIANAGQYFAAPTNLAEAATTPLLVDIKGRPLIRLLDSAGALLLPDVAALGDADANPTTTKIGAVLMGLITGGSTLHRVVVTPAGRTMVALGSGTNANSTTSAPQFPPDPADSGRPLVVAPFLFDGTNYNMERRPMGSTNLATNATKMLHAQAITAATGVTVWTPQSGKKFRLLGYCLSVTVACSVLFYDGVSGALTTKFHETPVLPANNVIVMPYPGLGNGLLSSAANNTMAIDVSATSNVTGTFFGVEE